jgi:phosphohistidine phosphatase
MKRLILIRHAKSSWKKPLSDIKRPLKKRGISDSILISNYTKELFNKPCIVLSSPSERTLETASFFIKNWNLEKVPFLKSEMLYDFSGEDLTKAISNFDINVNIAMVFTHNFAITNFVNKFGSILIDSVPTCGFVVIDFESNNWSTLANGRTSCKVFPKDLKNRKI